ncbi:hypothetical protein N7541_004287 [Penicillium brevicompactum]|uniref:Uncharacterized protein n=1 Tax=Penicillium brevicompactum TaxID=5074 RepID=A0A9W9UUK0_PENBR|nr:hypothetical protein N7541_004287 [Penicillium brevicompactum]
MYVQIPYENTLRSSQEVRGLQAEPSPVHDEYEALTSLSKSKSTAVPELLGYGQGKQGPEGYVPNGYITYIAWARVPGAPVDYQVFWKEGNRQYRDEVRAAFDVAYKELNKFPWQPGVRSPRKLIYDHVSQTIHFAGFRPAFKMTDSPMSVPTYALWGLLKFAVTRDGRVDRTAWAW